MASTFRSQPQGRKSNTRRLSRLRHDQDTSSKIFEVAADPQCSSPLFTHLPAEVRRLVWEFALADFADHSPGNKYSLMTYYTRPTYEAPRKTDARLLRTCRAVYFEAWSLPFRLREHTWWLTGPDRCPPEFDQHAAERKSIATAKKFMQSLKRAEGAQHAVAKADGGRSAATVEVVEVSEFKVFAQMYMLEGGAFQRLLWKTELNPRRVTLTIRHADWWFWEDDEPLRFEAAWLQGVSLELSTSTREFVLELETVARKKAQLDHIVAHISRKWFFRRHDGIILYGDTTGKSNEVSRWQGASAWNDKRWIRDECAPGKIDYYVVAVPFRARTVIEKMGGQVSEDLVQPVYSPEIMRVTAPGTPIGGQGWVEHRIEED